MVNIKNSNMRISLLEKLAVNFSLPFDFVYHTLKSTFVEDKYSEQTLSERARGIWQGKIDKYYKLLILKEKYNGEIPKRVQRVSKKSPCGYTRLMLTHLH